VTVRVCEAEVALAPSRRDADDPVPGGWAPAKPPVQGGPGIGRTTRNRPPGRVRYGTDIRNHGSECHRSCEAAGQAVDGKAGAGQQPGKPAPVHAAPWPAIQGLDIDRTTVGQGISVRNDKFGADLREWILIVADRIDSGGDTGLHSFRPTKV
jgi:hypothetical protein